MGQLPQYLVSRYLHGGVNTLRVNGSAEVSAQRVQLELPVDQITTSLVTLEVVADSLKFIVNSSPGKVRLGSQCHVSHLGGPAPSFA